MSNVLTQLNIEPLKISDIPQAFRPQKKQLQPIPSRWRTKNLEG